MAAGESAADFPHKIAEGDSVSITTTLVDLYTYIVVDNEGGGTTTLDVKAKVGETDAKTARGKYMRIIWF